MKNYEIIIALFPIFTMAIIWNFALVTFYKKWILQRKEAAFIIWVALFIINLIIVVLNLLYNPLPFKLFVIFGLLIPQISGYLIAKFKNTQLWEVMFSIFGLLIFIYLGFILSKTGS